MSLRSTEKRREHKWEGQECRRKGIIDAMDTLQPVVKVSRNAVPGPGNLSLERSGSKII